MIKWLSCTKKTAAGKKRHSTRRQEILSDSELELLFPDNVDLLQKIWGNNGKNSRDESDTALMFAALCCLTVSAGLRSDEVRGMQYDQLYPHLNGIIVDKAIDRAENLTYLKTAGISDPKFRVVIVPNKTWRILNYYLVLRGDTDGFLFTYHGSSITQSYLQSRFAQSLKRAGIDTENRKTTIHALRYTYNTKMRRLLDAETLRGFIGHRSENMTDHYDRPILEQELAEYQKKLPAVKEFCG